MCLIAKIPYVTGITEAFWEYKLKPWDCAAGILVVKEAGGLVTTLDGKDYTVFNPSLLVSNGHIHDQILVIGL